MSYCPPQWLVDSSTGRLKLSSCIAFFDEISTYAGTMAWDDRFRPGVSISLSGRATRPLDFNGRIYVETRRRKSGKTISFVDIVVLDENQRVMVKGQHIKFMPMSFPLNHIFHKRLARMVFPMMQYRMSLQTMEDLPLVGDIDHVFPLSNANYNGNQGTVNSVVDVSHGNPIGSIHGGAGVMLLEHATRFALSSNSKEEMKEPLAISASLISGISTKKKQDVQVHTVISSEDTGNSTFVRSQLLHQSKPAIDCVLMY